MTLPITLSVRQSQTMFKHFMLSNDEYDINDFTKAKTQCKAVRASCAFPLVIVPVFARLCKTVCKPNIYATVPTI